MPKEPYHHDGLKQVMIEKGLQLINKNGYEAFSLRQLACVCHVSHTAPYRHFKNKNELVSAITKEVGSKFQSALKEAANQYHDPRTQLLEICRQYVRFMVDHPDYFRYIFMLEHERPIIVTQDGFVCEGPDHPFNICKENFRISYCCLHGGDACWTGNFLALWSQIHGFTLMLVNRTIEYRGDYLDFVQHMVERFLDTAENGAGSG